MRFGLLFICSIIIFLSACSSSQDNALIGDFRDSSCDNTSGKCTSSSTLLSQTFVRDDNSDIILSKLDNQVELFGKCDIKTYTDSEIGINLSLQNLTAVNVVSGYLPIIGISTSGSSGVKPVAKCENGRWGLVLYTCDKTGIGNGLGTVGVHRLELTLRAKTSDGQLVNLDDGKIFAQINRTEACILP